MHSEHANPASAPRLDFAILCGGQGRRMGGVNKGLIKWQGIPMIVHLIDWVLTEINTLPDSMRKPTIWVVTNSQLSDYKDSLTPYQTQLNIELITDRFTGYLGPLAGIDTVFASSRAQGLQVLPCDCPTPPAGLVAKLAAVAQQDSTNQIFIPWDGERVQPLFSQLHRSCWPSLINALENEQLAVYRWMQQQANIQVDCVDLATGFKNINSMTTLEELINDASSD